MTFSQRMLNVKTSGAPQALVHTTTKNFGSRKSNTVTQFSSSKRLPRAATLFRPCLRTQMAQGQAFYLF